MPIAGVEKAATKKAESNIKESIFLILLCMLPSFDY
jgi:hypothetical protein